LSKPSYSPDLTPCDFFLFPEIKSVLKGTHLVLVENVKAKTVDILNSLTEYDLWNSLNIGSIVCSYVSTLKGTILKAILVDFLNLLNRVTSTVSFFFLCHAMYVERKETPLIQVVRTHQHNTDSAVFQTARCLKTEVQRETRKMKDSIVEKNKRKMVQEGDAWTIAK